MKGNFHFVLSFTRMDSCIICAINNTFIFEDEL